MGQEPKTLVQFVLLFLVLHKHRLFHRMISLRNVAASSRSSNNSARSSSGMSTMTSAGVAEATTIGAGMNRSESVINLQVEPVATFESSALQSSWIQRLKPAALQNSDDAVLQLPLTRLALDVTGNKALNRNLDNAQQLLNRIHIQSSKLKSGNSSGANSVNKDKQLDGNSLGPKGKGSSLFKHHSVAELNGLVPAMHQGSPNKLKGFGSFRVKLTNVKFRKPPLPPSKSPGKAVTKANGEALRRKEKADNFWKVHAIDVKLEQLHNATTGKDIVADFASRLDITEKSTFIGDFQQINVQKLSQDNCFGSTKLTPVISPRGSPLIGPEDCVFTSGSATASLSPEVLEQCKRENSKNSTDWSKASAEARRWADHSNREAGASRTLSSHCSSSSSPDGGGVSLRNSSAEDGSPHACTGSNQTEQSLKIRTVGISSIKGCSRIDQANEGISVATGKRKCEIFLKSTPDNVHQNGKVPSLVKRSRLSVEAASISTNEEAQAANEKNEYEGPLNGLWLRRWTSSSTGRERNENSRDKHGRTHTRVGHTFIDYGLKRGELDAPSAAAMAMVGTAARQLESYPSRRRSKAA